jgi:hypothetical protein
MTAARLLEAACWAAVCVGVWVLTLSVITWQELALAGSAAVLCGAAAVAARLLVGGRWTVRARWLRWPARLLVSAPLETAQVFGAAALRQSGNRTDIPVPKSEPKYVSASRRGFGTLVLSASPGSYVFDGDPDERVLHVHRLGSGAPEPFRIDPGER